MTATLISHAIQGELKIDLYSLPASCLLACAALYVYARLSKEYGWLLGKLGYWVSLLYIKLSVLWLKFEPV